MYIECGILLLVCIIIGDRLLSWYFRQEQKRFENKYGGK